MFEFNQEMKKCNNGLCDRQTKKGIVYCCAACAQANEGHYEIHPDGPLGHSESCDQRHDERGVWPTGEKSDPIKET